MSLCGDCRLAPLDLFRDQSLLYERVCSCYNLGRLQPWQDRAKFSKALVPPLLLGQVCSIENVSMENACCPTQYSQHPLARPITVWRTDLETRTLGIFDRFEVEVFDQLGQGGLAMLGEFEEVGDAIDVEQFDLLGELDEFLVFGGGELVGVALLHELADPLVKTVGEGVVDFVEEFGFGGGFWGEDADLEGLAFGEGEGNGGFEDAGFVGDGEVGHGEVTRGTSGSL